MPTLDSSLAGSVTIAKKTGTVVTFDTDTKYVSHDIELTIDAQEATHTFAGGVLTANNPTFTQTNAIAGDSDTAGVSVTATATSSVSKSTWTLDQSGWIDKPSSATQIKAKQDSGNKTNTLYITGVNIGASKNFDITVPNGNSTVTLNFAVDANGNVLVT